MTERAITVRIVGDDKDLTRAFQRSGAAAKGWAADLEHVGKSATRMGKTMSRDVTAPLLAIGVASVKMSNDFNESFDRMVGLAGVSRSEIAKLKKEVEKLAPEVGKSPKELADGLYFLASSGLKGRAALDALKVSAKGSAAGLGETQVVADAVSSAINAYGRANMTAAQAGDVLAATVREGKGEAAAMAPVLGNILPLAARLGVSFNDVGAAMASMTRKGTSAEEAATSIQAMFSSLLKTGPKAEKALNSVGLSSAGLRKELSEQGLLAVLKTLSARFGENDAAIARAFPNIRALRGLLSLTGKDAAETAAIFKRLENANGSLGDAFKAVAGDDAFKMKKSLAEMEVAAIHLGEKLAPVASKIAEDIGHVADAFSNLSPAEQNAIIKAGEFAAVIGPSMILLGKMATAVSALSKAFKVLAGAEGIAGATGSAKGLVSWLNILKTVGPIAIPVAIVVATAAFGASQNDGNLGTRGNTTVRRKDGKYFAISIGAGRAFPREITPAQAAEILGIPVAFLTGQGGGSSSGAANDSPGRSRGQGATAGSTASAVEGGGGFAGSPGGGTHSRTERGYIWQDDDAVDINMKPGAAVFALEDGTIGSNLRYGGDGGRFSGWGFTLLADSGNQYYYKHLKKVAVAAGDRVTRGQVVGYGTTTGHLHLARKGAGTSAEVLNPALPTTYKPTHTGSGGGGGGGDTGKKKGGVLPDSLQLAIEVAKGSKTTTDDLTALEKARDYLTTKLSHTKGASKQLPIVQEINSLNSSIESIKSTAAAAHLKKIHDAFTKGWDNQAARAMKGFDTVTQRHLKEMSDAQQALLDRLDAELSTKLDTIEKTRKAKTPEETAYAAFRKKRADDAEALKRSELQARLQPTADDAHTVRELADAQAALAALRAAGETDAVKIREAQQKVDDLQASLQDGRTKAAADATAAREELRQLDLDDEEAALAASATASREHADQIAADQKKAAEDLTTAKKKQAQTDYENSVQAYQEERDLARGHYQELLTEYAKHLLKKNELAQRAAGDLAGWLRSHPEFGVKVSDLPPDYNAAPPDAIDRYLAARGIKAIPMASGGTAVVDKPTLFLAGEKTSELAHFQPLGSDGIAGFGGGGGGDEFHLHVGTLIGSDLDRAAAQLLEPIRRLLARNKRFNINSGL